MTSLLTNTSAMSALRVLAGTQKALAVTETQVSTGLRVANASDNAAYWSIGTGMRSRVGMVQAVADGIALGSAIVDVACTGLTQIIGNLGRMNALVVSAATPGTDRAAIDQQLGALQQQNRSVAASASFNGVNLLQTDINADDAHTFVQRSTDQTRVVLGYGADGTANTLDISLQVPLFGATGPLSSGSATYGLLDYRSDNNFKDGSNIPNADAIGLNSGYSIDDLQTSTLSPLAGTPNVPPFATTIPSMLSAESVQIETMRSYLTGFAAKLGAAKSTLSIMGTFNTSLSDALTSGIGSLVDADMNVASTRLQALQTQQRLGIQALSIANDNSKAVLKLFG